MTFIDNAPKPSELIGKKFTVRLLGQEKYRGAEEEAATLLSVDSGLFLLHFEVKQDEVWVPLTQITSLVEIKPSSPPQNLTTAVVY